MLLTNSVKHSHFTGQLKGHVDVMELLIQNGADVNAVDVHGTASC